MIFLDQAKVHIKSGDGGAGCCSFRREAYVEYGGPDGGDGGRGGHVIAECVDGLNTLIDYRYKQHFKAKTGNAGAGRQKSGAAGADIVLKLPKGTQILEEDQSTVVADLVEVGQTFILARGGDGGFGNLRYKTSTNRSPRKALPRWQENRTRALICSLPPPRQLPVFPPRICLIYRISQDSLANCRPNRLPWYLHRLHPTPMATA